MIAAWPQELLEHLAETRRHQGCLDQRRRQLLVQLQLQVAEGLHPTAPVQLLLPLQGDSHSFCCIAVICAGLN